MATSAGGGGGRRSPPDATAAAAPQVVMESLIEVQEGATKLQTMLELEAESPTPSIAAPAGTTTSDELRLTILHGMMSSLSSAMSALDTTGGGAQGPAAQGRRRRRRGGAAAGPGPQRRSSARRRSHSPFVKTVTANTLDDGKSWRKYGQKSIQESPNNPRSYYRCTHRPEQGCRATRQVQASDTNPSEFIISYFGEHTCQDPSTMPLVIPDDTAPPPDDCANLISFQQAGSSSTMLLSRFGYSSSLPAADYRCGSEEALSSSSPAAGGGQLATGVVVGSAGTMASSATVGSAPAEYWTGGAASCDMAACGPGSFPSSPSSLGGFMTGGSPFGSFGNAGDDDLFGHAGDDDLFGFDP